MVKSRAFESPLTRSGQASESLYWKESLTWLLVTPAVKQPLLVTNARSRNMQPIAHSSRICKRFQLWRMDAWSKRRYAPSASKHSANLRL